MILTMHRPRGSIKPYISALDSALQSSSENDMPPGLRQHNALHNISFKCKRRANKCKRRAKLTG